MTRHGCSSTAGLLQLLVFLLVAVCAGSALKCHRSVCLDNANITSCVNNYATKLVNCSDLADNSDYDNENGTACIKYRVTGTAYRRMAGGKFDACDSLEVKTCFQFLSNASLDLGGRLQDALLYAGGVNETRFDVHICHSDACNAARKSDPATAALLAAAVGALVYRSSRR